MDDNGKYLTESHVEKKGVSSARNDHMVVPPVRSSLSSSTASVVPKFPGARAVPWPCVTFWPDTCVKNAQENDTFQLSRTTCG